jgi:hypothetical protein
MNKKKFLFSYLTNFEKFLFLLIVLIYFSWVISSINYPIIFPILFFLCPIFYLSVLYRLRNNFNYFWKTFLLLCCVISLVSGIASYLYPQVSSIPYLRRIAQISLIFPSFCKNKLSSVKSPISV